MRPPSPLRHLIRQTRRQTRLWGYALAAALLGAAAFLAPPAEPIAVLAPQVEAVAPGSAPPPASASPRRAPITPRSASPRAIARDDRERLQGAVAARAGGLKKCRAAPGELSELTARLAVGRSGKVKSAQLLGGAVASPLTACVREALKRWDFASLQLHEDVEVAFTLALHPGH